MRTIAVFNRKGGSGKTTMAVNLAAALGERGTRVLLIDLDAGASATEWLGTERAGRAPSTPAAGLGDLARYVESTQVPGVDLIPARRGLADAEARLRADLSVNIARAIRGLDPRWSFVLVDCPPTLSYLTVGVLAGVGEVIIPVEAHAIALPGIDPVLGELQRLRSSLRTGLRSATIVPCRVARTRHSWAVIETLEREYGPLVSRTRIRESVRVAEAWDARLPVTQLAPGSGASADFRELAGEVAAGPTLARQLGMTPTRAWGAASRAHGIVAVPPGIAAAAQAPARVASAVGTAAPVASGSVASAPTAASRWADPASSASRAERGLVAIPIHGAGSGGDGTAIGVAAETADIDRGPAGREARDHDGRHEWAAPDADSLDDPHWQPPVLARTRWRAASAVGLLAEVRRRLRG
jgi:chromosome partitioning protein